MHAVHKCGLLLQMSHVASCVCLSVCMCVLSTRVNCAKIAEPIEMPFWGLTHVGPMNHSNVVTAGECACPAHVVDECIRRHEG